MRHIGEAFLNRLLKLHRIVANLLPVDQPCSGYAQSLALPLPKKLFGQECNPTIINR